MIAFVHTCFINNIKLSYQLLKAAYSIILKQRVHEYHKSMEVFKYIILMYGGQILSREIITLLVKGDFSFP